MVDRSNLLIVGGSRGIGLALATKAIENRDLVTVVARTKTDNFRNSEINFIKQDFNDISLARSTLATVKPDVLILCVAQGLYGDILSFSNEQIVQCIQTSYTSTVLWIREAIDVLPKNSKICWISSLTAKIPNYHWSYYASAKAGVGHFIECVREQAATRGISITVCYPGCVATDFHRYAGTQTPEGAINAAEIAGNLLQAVESRLEFWASDMDREVIDKIYELDKTCRHRFQDLLK
jgi:short-subunit dehydrogenase